MCLTGTDQDKIKGRKERRKEGEREGRREREKEGGKEGRKEGGKQIVEIINKDLKDFKKLRRIEAIRMKLL